MQPPTAPPRDALTAAKVTTLLRDAPALTLTGGLEIVDRSLTVLDDVSDDLAGGSVTRQSYANLHGSCQLRVTRQLDWGAGLVRPYLIVAGGGVSARFNLGVYHTSTPATALREGPPTFEVEGYDMLLRLSQPVGDTYSIAVGDAYLAKVEDILVGRGYLQYLIDPAQAAVVAPAGKVWALTDNITWLTVVNDLLAAIGYRGIWSDWDGRLRVEPYQRPIDRAPEWFYTDDTYATMLSVERSLEYDFFAAPNRWVVWRSNMLADATPVEGNGLFTFINQSVGDTSVDARDGMVITRAEGVDAADQGSLVSLAQQMIDADMQVPHTFAINTSPNPLHWHFDRMLLSDSASLPYADVMCTQWTLQLPPDSGDMQQQWTVLIR